MAAAVQLVDTLLGCALEFCGLVEARLDAAEAAGGGGAPAGPLFPEPALRRVAALLAALRGARRLLVAGLAGMAAQGGAAAAVRDLLARL